MTLILDGSFCPTQRPVSGQRKWFDGEKHHGHGFAYESKYNLQLHHSHLAVVGTSFFNGIICWVAGPVRAVENDLTMARTFDSLSSMEDWERAMADLAYVGWSHRCKVANKRRPGQPLTREQAEYNKWFGYWRSIVEHAIARIKKWNVLKAPWKYDNDKHSKIFHLAARIARLDQHVEPLRRRGNVAACD